MSSSSAGPLWLLRGPGSLHPYPQAVVLYELDISENNDEECMRNLALLLERGAEGVAMNLGCAKKLYERAIREDNDVVSMYNLAKILELGAMGGKREAVRAAQLYERAIAEGNHVDAMLNLAMLLEKGVQEVPKDSERAMRLYERAIEEANVTAMVKLAEMLERGANSASLKRAARLYERAIEEGYHVGAMVNLAMLLEEGTQGVPKDSERAMCLYERAMGENNDSMVTRVDAMVKLAGLLDRKAHGEVADVMSTLAVVLLERATAEGEHVDAMVEQADMLKHYRRVEEWDSRVTKLYERAIEQEDHVDAMVKLAEILERKADDGERNSTRAVELYGRAIEKGQDVRAMNKLGLLLQKGAKGVAVNAERAMNLFELAIWTTRDRDCESNLDAKFNLAVLLQDGAGSVPADVVQAVKLYHQVALFGDERRRNEAMKKLAWLAQNGSAKVAEHAKDCMLFCHNARSPRTSSVDFGDIVDDT